MRVRLVDNVQDITALERNAELMTWDVKVVLRAVGEVGSVVVNRLVVFLLAIRDLVNSLSATMDLKYFEYQFLATLNKGGQVIPNDGGKRGGRKG